MEIKICMEVVLGDRLSGFRDVGRGEIRPFPLLWPLAYTTACNTVQAVIDTRGSTIAERPARRSVSVKILAYCCTINTNRSRVSLKSTISNCHVLFRYLHSFVYMH